MGRIWKDRVTGREYRDNMAAEHLAMSAAQVGAPLLRPITAIRVKPKATIIRYGADTAFIDELWHCGSHLMTIKHVSLPGLYEVEAYQYKGWTGLMASAVHTMNSCMTEIFYNEKWAPVSQTQREHREQSRRHFKVYGMLPADKRAMLKAGSDNHSYLWFTYSYKHGIRLRTHFGRPYGSISFSERLEISFRKVRNVSLHGEAFSGVLKSFLAFSADGKKAVTASDAPPKYYPKVGTAERDVRAVSFFLGTLPVRVESTKELHRDCQEFSQLCAKHGIHHLLHPAGVSLRLDRKNRKSSRRRGSEL